MSDFLFVIGCPRIATTELTRILNNHPKICIGMERFKYIYERDIDSLSKDLFNDLSFLSLKPLKLI